MIEYIFAFIFFILLLFLAYRVRSFKDKGFDETIDYVEYEPPEDLNSMYAGYLVDRRLSKKDIFSLMVSAHKKNIIYFEKNDSLFSLSNYSIKTSQDNTDDLLGEFKIFINSLNFPIELDLNGKRIARYRKKIKDELYKLGYLKKDFIFKRTIAIIIFAFLLITYIYFLFTNPLSFEVKDLVKSTYFVIILISILFIKQKNFSKKGLETRRELRGFKDYLEKVEKSRAEYLLKELPTPQERIEKIPHLEYLIAFGLISIKDVLS